MDRAFVLIRTSQTWLFALFLHRQPNGREGNWAKELLERTQMGSAPCLTALIQQFSLRSHFAFVYLSE
jgi:hypothetical protein